MTLFGRTAGDEQGERKGTGERSCAATAPRGIPGWMHALWLGLRVHGQVRQSTFAVPPACCRGGRQHVHAFHSRSS